MRVVSIDPGQRAGALTVFSDPVTIAGLMAWSTYTKGGRKALRLRWAYKAEDGIASGALEGLHSGYRLGVVVANRFRAWGLSRIVLACEDTFVGQSPKVALTSARWTGAFLGPLEDLAAGEVLFLRADEWRAKAFGIRRFTKREDAKRLTRAALPAVVLAQVVAMAALTGGEEHAIDAAGIGLCTQGLLSG